MTSTYLINQNNIDTIFEKCCRYISENEYKYNRLKWQKDVLEQWTSYHWFERSTRQRFREVCCWYDDVRLALNKIKPIYELAENIVACYIRDTEAFEEMFVDSVLIESILAY